MRLRAGSLAAFVALAACGSASENADLVLRGGLVRTMAPADAGATAVAVRAGRIVYVGDDGGATEWIGAGTEVVELGGRLVLPGFHDTHVHVLDGGVAEGDCDLRAAASRAEIALAIEACAARASTAPWVRGGGYDPTIFPGGEPARELLDSLVPDRPAYFTDATEHAGWVNSRGLALAGIDADTPDPDAGGAIVRRPDGSPQGTLRESAMELVARHLPERSDAELTEGLARGLALAASLGVTTIHEAAADERTLQVYAAAEAEGWLTARARLFLLVEPDGGTGRAREVAALRDRHGGRLARVAGAKVFLDGVLEGGTAALLEPYVDRPGWLGELRWPEPDSVAALVAGLEAAGLTAHFHAIGDRAVRTALDAVERARPVGGRGGRHVVAHLQLVEPSDLPRFGALGMVASFQPLWAQRDAYIVELTEPRVGDERSGRLYPIRSVLAAGADLAAGSDWPVTTMDPLDAIEVAVTRRNELAGPGEPWIPSERLTVGEAVRAYTLGGAYAAGMDDQTGAIAVGRLADLVVLDRDIFTIDPTAISDTRVDLTVLEGRIVHRSPAR
jgi:predicted amidohydrolase YtcJ